MQDDEKNIEYILRQLVDSNREMAKQASVDKQDVATELVKNDQLRAQIGLINMVLNALIFIVLLLFTFAFFKFAIIVRI